MGFQGAAQGHPNTVSGIIRSHTKPEQKFNPLPQTQGSSGRALGMLLPLEFKDTNSPGLEVTGWEGNLLAQRYHRESMFVLCESNLEVVVGEADGSFNIVSPATETEPLHRILWITCSQNKPDLRTKPRFKLFFFFCFLMKSLLTEH